MDELQENLAMLWEQHLPSLLLHHRVHAGDSWSILANRYHTSVAEIREMNKLKGNMIRIGENLLIPEVQATPYTSNNSHISEDNILGVPLSVCWIM
ncbi:LysM peptidoglycan-binding domain-containing protein [Coxiella-like endosymbiont]|uniref:LysM peptidoglycan-binding domain-containing protein n=1 Tax=Coxiella-like endosymbiont TaxID=1592897 RepID=UPI00272C7C06|nr:LysM peptidoglycan-binding domain-containing protein [Coxiella-like endosymbiont]